MKIIYPLLLGALLAGCATVKTPKGYVTAFGTELYDSAEDGRPIVLKGVNAGGWLVTENWMCPNKVAATQTETYEDFVC